MCIVGRSYPPEFYSWIKVPHVRQLFEQIAIETEEDYQNIIKTLQNFGVQILRPDLGDIDPTAQIYPSPPMTPRDHMVMIGDRFYDANNHWHRFYQNIKDPAWPTYSSYQDFVQNAPYQFVDELHDRHHGSASLDGDPRYAKIFQHIEKQGNTIRPSPEYFINGAMVSRIGRDLYFGTENASQDQNVILHTVNREFRETRNHVVNSGGHGDGVYCPVCPGLIVSLKDIPTYAETFPDWEVVYLPGQSWNKIKPFLKLKIKNKGRWWIPGFEQDDDVINTVEQWLSHWVGYVEETVFDVNMLIIDPKNVMVFNENPTVFKALHRYGITPHVVPFRHRYFWDGGIHCVTTDLHREGEMQDFFPDLP